MRTVSVLVAALVLAVTGCTFSSVDPDAPIHISGRALNASGEPLAGARVMLFKQADLGEVLFGTVLAIGTLSTVCLLPEPPAICRKARVTTTDGEGRYEFELKGSDTQGTLGTESTLNVVFAGPAAQGGTTLSFTAQDTEISLPAARLWRAAPELTGDSGTIGLTWRSLPRDAGSEPAYSAQLYAGKAQTAFWSEPASGSGATIDARIMEDQSGSVAVSAATTLSGGSGAGEVRASYLSARLPVEAAEGAPPSRGRPCGAVSGTARPVDGELSSCTVTDGDLTSPARPTARKGAVVTGVVIDLGDQRSVSLVVARGFAGQFVVEVSSDGRRYRTVATSAESGALALPDRPTARFVRLRSPAGLDQSLLSELSVW